MKTMTSASADALTTALARVHRSHQLGYQLEAAIAEYFSSVKRIEISERFDSAKSEYIFSARLAEPLPVEWQLLLSDAIHQARAACDNIVFALIQHRGAQPSNRACFPPIFKTKAEYEAWKSPRKVRSPLDGLLVGDLEQIEQFQPWHPKATATSGFLRILQRLSNEDKHKLVHTISVCVTSWGNHTTGEAGLYGFPFAVRPDGGIDAIINWPPERLFPPLVDVAGVGAPKYLNEPLTLEPTDIVRIPVTLSGSNPRLEFRAPRLRVLYTDRGFDEFSVAPTVLPAWQAAREVIEAVKPLFVSNAGNV